MIRFQERQVGGVMLGVVLLAVAVALVGCGSSGKAAAGPTPSEEKEVEEYDAEYRAELTDPTIPHELGEIVIARPRNEEATTAQLSRQIISNEQNSDPRHEAKAWCSYSSAYGDYINYRCQGYEVGAQPVLGELEVSVNKNTGEVFVEAE